MIRRAGFGSAAPPPAALSDPPSARLPRRKLRRFMTTSLNVEQLARLHVPRSREAVLARGHARQCRQLSPAEGGAGRGELLGHRAVVFLGVQGTILADR